MIYRYGIQIYSYTSVIYSYRIPGKGNRYNIVFEYIISYTGIYTGNRYRIK